MEHEEFENKLMDMLLDGDDDVLKEIRNQFLKSTVKSREFTGGGFYTNYIVDKQITPVANGKTFEIMDVYAYYRKIEYTLGFILFIKNGHLTELEGYTVTEFAWPYDYSEVTLKYDSPDGKRDSQKLKSIWS